MARLVDRSSYLSRSWSIPLDHIIDVYQRMGSRDDDVDRTVLQKGLLVGFLIFHLLRAVGPNLFDFFGKSSPMFNHDFLTYPIGGIDHMVAETFKCWQLASRSIESSDSSLFEKCDILFTSHLETLQSLPSSSSNLLKDWAELIGSLGVDLEVVTDSDGFLTLDLKRQLPDDVLETLLSTSSIRNRVTTCNDSLTSGKTRSTIFTCNSCQSSMLGENLVTGDFNADGLTDVVITAPLYSSNDCIFQGAVFVMDGSRMRDYPTGKVDLDDPTLSIGKVVGDCQDQLGKSIVVGDLNGDKFDDLVVKKGDSLIIYFGGANGLTLNSYSEIVMSMKMEKEMHTILNFGLALHLNMDFDGDGIADLVIGNPFISSQALWLQASKISKV